MKTQAEKSSTTAARQQQASSPFFGKSGSGDFFAPAVQTKLTVGKADDKYEKEADMMADKAVQRAAMPNVQAKCDACEEKEKVQRKPLADGITPFIQRKEMEEEPVQRKEEEEEPVQAKQVQRKAAEEEEPVQAKQVQRKAEEEEEPVQAKRIQRKAEEEEEPVQTKQVQRKAEEEEEPVQAKQVQRKAEEEEEPVQAKSATAGARPSLGMVEWALGDAKGLGSSMPDPVRQEMEAGFGVDMGRVRIHTDQAAVDMSQMLNAQAFTHGWDVFFNQHKYNPNTVYGKLLLAHELAHTLQQAKANGEALRPAPTRVEQEIPVVPDEGQAMQAALEQAEMEADKIKEQAAAEPSPEQADGAVEGQQPAKTEVPTDAPQIPACKVKPAASNAQAAAPAAAPPSIAPAPVASQNAEPAIAQAPQETEAPATQAAPAPAAPAPQAAPAEQAAAPTVAEQSPKCPANDPAFAQAKKTIDKDAKKQRSHEPAEQKRDEAMAASALPTAEQNVQSGQEQQAANLEQAAQPKPFNRAEFKQKLKDKIESKMPENEDQAKAFAGSGKLEQAKEEFKGSVGEEKGKVSGPLEQTAAAPALPEGKDLKPDSVQVPNAQPADKPAQVAAGLAAPKPRTDAEISLEHKSKGLDDQMAQEGLKEKQLEEWEETEEPKALTAKRDAQREIAAAPGQYREIEAEKLAQSGKQAGKATGKGLASMEASKNKKTGEVFGGQKQKETATEAKQRQIKLDIDNIYTSTETDVKTILDDLGKNVEQQFSIAVEAANETFKNRVRSRLDDHYGWFTFDDKIAEWAGLSDGVAHIFREEKEQFISTMDGVLDEIATTVETELNKALERIKSGRKALDDFKKNLSEDELKFAEDMLAEAGDKFGELEASVYESQDELIETLSDQYVESVNKLQEEFDKINEELSASWIADALSFIGEVASAIKKLGQLLSSIASRIGQYIGEILDSPKRFFNNLVDGIQGGMDDFRDNIDTYMEQGFWMWLTGASSATNIQVPKTMDAEGMFSLATQILGLTKEFVMERIKSVLRIPVDAFLALVDKAQDIGAKVLEPVKILITQGIGALWVWVKDEVSGHLSEIFSKLKEEIFQAIIKKFLLWVAQLFIPGLGFIKLIMAAYKALKWLVDNIDRIVEIVNSFLDAIGLAVLGNVSAIKQKVVKALTNGVVIAIDFLAKLVGLGNFGDKLQRGIEMLRKPVRKAIDFILKKAKPVVRKIMRAVEKGVKMVKGGVKKGVEKIVKWWKEKKKFTNKAGEEHTLFFEGEDKGAELMIATKKMTVSKFLSTYPNKTDKDFLTAKGIVSQQNKIIFTAASVGTASRAHRQKVIVALGKISAAFAKLGGVLPQAVDYPATTPPHCPANPPKKNTIKYLVGTAKGGSSATPKGRNTGTSGWDQVWDANLTLQKNKWVQMHVISDKLGGVGKPANLISAPQHINRNFASFENSVAKLAKGTTNAKLPGQSNKKVKNVVWVEVSVDYTGVFANTISGKAGLYLFDGAGKTPVSQWLKNASPVIQDTRKIPLPKLYTQNKVSLNLSSGTELRTVIKNSTVAKEIKLNRYYSSFPEFEKKIGAALSQYKGFGAKKIDNEVTKIKNDMPNKIVLNNPK